tara:strand:+ start:746 stop:1018 length:273 start_codon:yes stop_codon:yes gene_type:complete
MHNNRMQPDFGKLRFRPYNHDQDTMVVINYKEQLQPGTFEHAVHYLIQHKLDLSVFYPVYRNKDTGRLAYDPTILLPIIEKAKDGKSHSQ